MPNEERLRQPNQSEAPNGKGMKYDEQFETPNEERRRKSSQSETSNETELKNTDKLETPKVHLMANPQLEGQNQDYSETEYQFLNQWQQTNQTICPNKSPPPKEKKNYPRKVRKLRQFDLLVITDIIFKFGTLLSR